MKKQFDCAIEHISFHCEAELMQVGGIRDYKVRAETDWYPNHHFEFRLILCGYHTMERPLYSCGSITNHSAKSVRFLKAEVSRQAANIAFEQAMTAIYFYIHKVEAHA
jgi:hypothetical protein